jgi:hypothetical protein
MNKATSASGLAVRTHVGRNGKNFGSLEWTFYPRDFTPGPSRFDTLKAYFSLVS